MTEHLSDDERQALRLLAICCDDDYPGLLSADDYGDEEFDTGLLITANGRTCLSTVSEDLVSAGQASGLDQRCPAFRLLLALYDGLSDDNEEMIETDIACGRLHCDHGQLRPTPRGLAEISVELALLV